MFKRIAALTLSTVVVFHTLYLAGPVRATE